MDGFLFAWFDVAEERACVEAGDSAVLKEEMGLLACYGENPFAVLRNRGDETLLRQRFVRVLKTLEIGPGQFGVLAGKNKVELGVGAAVRGEIQNPNRFKPSRTTIRTSTSTGRSMPPSPRRVRT